MRGEYLARLQPDLLRGGHSFVMAQPGPFSARYRRWAYEMRDAFRALCPDEEYRPRFDPFWVRVEPYRTTLAPGARAELKVWVRNVQSVRQTCRIGLHAAPGLRCEPAVIEGALEGESRGMFPEWFDFVVKVAGGESQ